MPRRLKPVDTSDPTERARVLAKLEELSVPEPNTGCHLWLGTVFQSGGYGQIKAFGDARRAHRMSYELRKGPIPPGLVLDHLCRVTCCINPDHLEAVTDKVNILRSESVSARAARRSECNYGHPLEPLERPTDGGRRKRVCLTCRKVNAYKYKLDEQRGAIWSAVRLLRSGRAVEPGSEIANALARCVDRRFGRESAA